MLLQLKLLHHLVDLVEKAWLIYSLEKAKGKGQKC